MQSKICSSCGVLKNINDFHKRKSAKDGFRCECKDCRKAADKIRYERDKDKILLKQKEYESTRRLDPNHALKVKAWGKNHYLNNPLKYILARCRNRAKVYDLDFDLELSDIVVPETCPILHIPLRKGDGKPESNSPSVDRIDNNKGYVKGNIQIISQLANTMKNSATPEQLLLFAKWIIMTYK